MNIKKILKSFALFSILSTMTLIIACKKSEISLDTKSSTNTNPKVDFSRISKAKKFYETNIRGKIFENDLEMVPLWENASIADLSSQEDAIVVPVDFVQEYYCKFGDNSVKISVEENSRIWFYESSPNIFSVELVTTLNDPNNLSETVYFVENLATEEIKTYTDSAGVVTSNTFERTTTKNVFDPKCLKIDWFWCTRNLNTGEIFNCNYSHTTEVCQNSDAPGGTSYNPNDENATRTRSYKWTPYTLADHGYFWEVLSYEALTGQRFKNSSGKFDWKFINIEHSRSIFDNHTDNRNTSYQEIQCLTNVISDNYCDVKFVARILEDARKYSIDRYIGISRNQIIF
jgi:hypothetical protein